MRRERARLRKARSAMRTLELTRAFALLLLIGAVGCSSAPVAPTYSQDELKASCERHRGVWHPDDLMGGYCEYRAA